MKPPRQPSIPSRMKRKTTPIPSVAAVYYARAVKDPSNRDKWTEQAVFYVDKSVSLSPDDSINLMEAAFSIDRIVMFPPKVARILRRHATTPKTRWAS